MPTTKQRLLLFGKKSNYQISKNFLTSPGTVFEDFETYAQWTGVGTGSIAANTTNFRTGAKSLKITTLEAAIERADKTINWLPGGSAPARLRVSFFSHEAAPTDVTYIRLYLDQGTNIAWEIYYYAAKVNPTIQPGWNTWDIYPANWVAGGGSPNWTDAMVRLRVAVSAKTAQVAEISFDEILLNTQLYSSVMMTFDDKDLSVYLQAYSYMHARKQNATFFINSDSIDGAGEETSVHLLEMSNGGWSIGNHTTDHTNLTTLSQVDATAKLADCKTALDGWGLTKASMHASYPNGALNETVRLAAIDAGILTGRAAVNYATGVADENYFYPSACTLDNTVTLAAAKVVVDLAYSTKRIAVFYGHKLAAAAASQTWAIADFKALVDYIMGKEMPFITINDYYNAQSGAITVVR